jgi:hypothetical protein
MSIMLFMRIEAMAAAGLALARSRRANHSRKAGSFILLGTQTAIFAPVPQLFST